MVSLAESPPCEQCDNILDTVTMANNVHERKSTARALESPIEGTMGELAQIWHEWRG